MAKVWFAAECPCTSKDLVCLVSGRLLSLSCKHCGGYFEFCQMSGAPLCPKAHKHRWHRVGTSTAIHGKVECLDCLADRRLRWNRQWEIECGWGWEPVELVGEAPEKEEEE